MEYLTLKNHIKQYDQNILTTPVLSRPMLSSISWTEVDNQPTIFRVLIC